MRTLLLLFLLAVVGSTAAEVYRWTDEKGEVHYSDRPHEDAEVVVLPKAQTYTAPAQQDRTDRSQAADDQVQGGGKVESVYSSLRILSPEDEEVLSNTGGKVRVAISIVPSLRNGHSLLIYLDDRKVEELTGGQRETELTDVYRGEHTLYAEVRDAAGVVFETGKAVKFTVRQTSIQNPNNPNVPIPTPR